VNGSNLNIFQLNGKPFWADSTDGIDSKLLICALLTRLQRRGWRIHNFISPTRSLENKGTLIFRKEPSSEVSPMCISFDDEVSLSFSKMFLRMLKMQLASSRIK